MKIIFILPNLGAGGAEKVVTLLAKEFISVGVTTDIVLMLDGKIQYDIPECVNVIKLNTLEKNRIERLKIIRKYLKEEKSKEKDIVLIPFLDTCLKNVLAASIGIGVKIIASERNNPFLKGNTAKNKIIANVPYYFACGCVFQTEDAKNYFCRAVRKKGIIIPNPIKMEFNSSFDGNRDKRIVSVGRLEPQKNHRMLIEAFNDFHKSHQEYILEIFGEGSLKQRIEEQIKSLSLENSVFLRGIVDDIPQRIYNASMFVLSSDYEGMSNALLEAMALGVPVISTDHPIGGARAVIENKKNGMLINVGDEEALSTAMSTLADDSEYANYLGRNAAEIRNKLSCAEVASKWLDYIKAL